MKEFVLSETPCIALPIMAPSFKTITATRIEFLLLGMYLRVLPPCINKLILNLPEKPL